MNTPEQIVRKLGHEIRGFVQQSQDTALRLQRMHPEDQQTNAACEKLLAKGKQCITNIQALQEKVAVPRVPPLRILIAEDDPETMSSLVENVQEQLHHDVVGQARNGTEMERMLLDLKPDLVLFDIHLPNQDGLTALQKVMKSRPLPGVAITGDTDLDLLERVQRDTILGYLIKPVEAIDIAGAIMVAWSRWKEFESLRTERDTAQTALQNRKVIERAKGVLMDRHRWSEASAFRALQETAKFTQKPLVDVAVQVNAGKKIVERTQEEIRLKEVDNQ